MRRIVTKCYPAAVALTLSLALSAMSGLALSGTSPAEAQTASPSVSPTASPNCTTGVVVFSFDVNPKQITAGDAVMAGGDYRDSGNCATPFRATITLLAKTSSDAEFVAVESTVTRDDDTYSFSDRHPLVTTTYNVSRNGVVQEHTARTVTVTSASPSPEPTRTVTGPPSEPCSSCTSTTIQGPTYAVYGTTIWLSGTAKADSEVRVYFHRRGIPGYNLRRVLWTGPDGRFTTSYVANDDYRYFAVSNGVTSAADLTQLRPTISGPALVQRFALVQLSGKYRPGAQVGIYFRRRGASGFTPRRVLTVPVSGTFTTSYLANDDYRYYALAGQIASSVGLTQVT